MKDIAFSPFTHYLEDCQQPTSKITTKRECIKKLIDLDINLTPGPDIAYLTQSLSSVVR